MLNIYSNFDSGNIEIVDIHDPQHIQLKIRKDSNAEFFQWFYFQVIDPSHKHCKLHIINAEAASYAAGWKNYQAVASYDKKTWFRVATHYSDKQLVIEHKPEQDIIYYAFFAPYTQEQLHHFLSHIQPSPLCKIDVIGHSAEKRPMHLLTIGHVQRASTKKLKCWLIARQHCGETMGSWWMEGFISRLLDAADPVSRRLLEKAVFYIAPMMNPDGAVLGNLRANAMGTDLNRAWAQPSLEQSPEVFHVLNKMHETGVDFFMDVHGDETLPYNFLVGCEANDIYTPRIERLEKQFIEQLKIKSPDFQDEHGYARNQFGKQKLTLATNHVGLTFDCLSFTLEMPFHDNALLPDATYGWSPERCKKLSSAVLDTLYAVIDELR